ncbi:MAG: hypothetical protein K2Y37_17095 [Pirellulales bacterium]|nr:hypothetical protein [Pirellulales bacterium]
MCFAIRNIGLGLPLVLCLTMFATAAEPPEALPAAAASPVSLPVAESWPIAHDLHHVQGLAVSDQWFWITSVDRRARRGFVYRVARDSLKVVAQRDITLDRQIHPGGMQLAAERLWIPLAEYRPRSTSTVLELDPASLETLGKFTLADHLGGAAYDGRERLYAANWDARTIYLLDLQGKELERRDNPTGVAYQDFEYHDGRLYAAGNTKIGGEPTAVVDVIDVANWSLAARYVLRGQVRSGGSNFCREGFCKFGGSFYVLPEDGPSATVYRFAVPAEISRTGIEPTSGATASSSSSAVSSSSLLGKPAVAPNTGSEATFRQTSSTVCDEAKDELPKEVDLRPQFGRWNLAPRRQGRRNTCSVFVTAGALEFALARHRDAGAPLSVEYLNWACNQEIGNTTADRGQFFHDLLKGFERHGICREDLMPYERRFANAQPNEAARQEAEQVRQLGFEVHWIRRWSKSSGLTDEELAETRGALAASWPVCAGSNHSRLFVGYADNADEPGGGTFITRDSGLGRYGAVSYEWARANLYDLFWVEIAADEAAAKRPPEWR